MKVALVTAMSVALMIGAVSSVSASDHNTETGQSCLRLNRIDNWTMPDNQTLIISNSSRELYKVGLIGACPGLRFKQQVAFKSFGGSQTSCLSSGDSIRYYQQGMGRSSCVIDKVMSYSAEMQSADEAARRQLTQ